MSELETLISMKILKRHKALLPLVAITGVASCLSMGYVAYMCTMKNDLSWHPSDYSTKAPYRNIDPEYINKFINGYKGKIVRIPEVENIRAELSGAKAQ